MRDDDKKDDQQQDPPARFVIDWPAAVAAFTTRSIGWQAAIQNKPGYRDPRVVFDPAKLAAVAAALDGLTLREGAAILDAVIMGAALHISDIRALLPSTEAGAVARDLIHVAEQAGARENGLRIMGVGMTIQAATTEGKQEVKH